MNKIAFLIESELEKAEVVLAAKSITDSIQKMAETVAKMEAEDVMPLNDPIREHFGPEAAQAFAEAVSTRLRALTQSLSETKTAISDEIARMQGELDGLPQNDLATMDDGDVDSGKAPAGDLGDLSLDNEDDSFDAFDADAPKAGDDAAATAPIDSFDDEGSLKAAGRARKESAEPKGRILENADREVGRGYVRLVREGKSPADAMATVTNQYGITPAILLDIVSGLRR